MSWLVLGPLCLGPAIGAAIVAVLVALHELRSRGSRLSLSAVGRRASTELLEEFLAEEPVLTSEAAGTGRARRRPRVLARRKAPALLYALLDERQPRQLPARRPRSTVAARAPRPTRLVPLTA